MHFVREIWLRHVKYACGRVRDLFHFTLRPRGAIFHNLQSKLFHIRHRSNISLKLWVVILTSNTKKKASQTERTLKDSFWKSIEYATYRQEKDEELLKFLVLFSWQALHLRPQERFNFVDMPRTLGSIYLPWANSICLASLKLDMI